MRLNTKPKPIRTHEGAKAKRINSYQQLRRSVLACMLWEREFYEDGVSIADRIEELCEQVTKTEIQSLAIEARERFNLRHVPLLLLVGLCKKGGPGVAETINAVVQRPDELSELIAIYWRNGKKPLPNQMKKGLAKAFLKFDEYQLAKYNRDREIKLRDVMFLVHPKPPKEKEGLFKRLAENNLATPDTWEVALSTGGDKKDEFTRLLREGKLGYMALLRNLRNMVEADVDPDLIKHAILARKGARRVLPFRYTAAARACPRMEPVIDQSLVAAIGESTKFDGKTVVLVDVSGSMFQPISAKSDLTRADAAATLGSIINGDVRTFTFTRNLVEVPYRKGMAGVDTILNSQPKGWTYLGAAVRHINENVKHDRLIVITDEQSQDPVPDPVSDKAYMINVASYRNGVGYGKWTNISGFSEAVLNYIHEYETTDWYV